MVRVWIIKRKSEDKMAIQKLGSPEKIKEVIKTGKKEKEGKKK